jgi:hypothetical protein
MTPPRLLELIASPPLSARLFFKKCHCKGAETGWRLEGSLTCGNYFPASGHDEGRSMTCPTGFVDLEPISVGSAECMEVLENTDVVTFSKPTEIGS